MLVLGTEKTWGQTDYSGVYYIASGGNTKESGGYTYNSSTPANNFYLVPTCEPAAAANKSDVFHDNTGEQDPFLTTYKIGQDNEAVWVLQQVTDDDGTFYYVIHVKTNKYVVYDPYYSGYNGPSSSGNWRRKCMHLQASSGENAKFVIGERDGAYYFIPKVFKDVTPGQGSPYIFWNIADGNKNNRQGQGASNYWNGLVGLYGLDSNKDELDSNSKWKFETALLAAPTISDISASNTITITDANSLPAGYTIRYTTGDGTQNAPTATTGNVYSGPIDVTSGMNVKAVVVRYGIVLTEVASKTVVSVIAAPTVTNNGDGTISLSTTTAGATIYYTTNGETPDNTSAEYSSAFSFGDATIIKAIAYLGAVSSDVTTYEIPQCAKPVITISGGNVTITCATEGAAIHYTTDGSPATSSSTTYTAPFAKGNISAIRAIATKAGYVNSNEAAVLPPTEVSSSSQITNMSGNYILASNFTSSGSIGTSDNPFTGTIDGAVDGELITRSLSYPLVAYADGATIKNVILDDVTITSGNENGNTGAICNEATGATRIYNCGVLATTSSTISGSGHVGSIVGSISGNTRVINCYSFANVNGGSYTAGIVGYNPVGTTQATVETAGMVMNCMFYGNITGSNISPVYGGELIDNASETGVNNYNYYRRNRYDKATDTYVDDVTFDNNFSIDDYHRSWPADAKYLTRFEYYRSILNSNKKLCTWWVNGTNGTAPSDADIEDVGIAKWVLDLSIAPYPILKKWGKYPSVINQDPDKRVDPTTKTWVNRANASDHWGEDMAPDTEGQILGTVNVTINAGSYHSGSTSKPIKITAMDTEYNDYCYGKIQLPYYNEIFGNPNGGTWEAKYGGNYTAHVVTGWDISGGSDATDYNFADRNNYSGRVFAQGGYFYVPKGVTSISITAHWADAVYLCNKDYSIDRVDVASGKSETQNSTAAKVAKYGSAFTPAGTISNEFQNQSVYTTIQEAISHLSAKGSNNSKDVYNQAIVLIGNVQVRNHSYVVNLTGNNSKPFTLMSADLDFDNEPDNCLELQFRNDIDRPGVQPIRFDFLPVPELGLAIRTNKKAYAIGIMIPLGHFEITETAFMHTTQFEYDANVSRTGKSPVIINGGEHEMFTKRKQSGTATQAQRDRTSYFLLGGNAWVHRFAPGAHPNAGDKPDIYLFPVNVIGGQVKELYLTGLYRPELPITTGNNPSTIGGAPRCYIDGGKFDIVAGAGYDKVSPGEDVIFKINHSLIGEFYGGGINASNPVSGNIDVTINNSKVDKYCGGPKVGVMTAGKTVKTDAKGTTFGVFYGGGNGGNSYYRQLQRDGDFASSYIGDNWPNKPGNDTGSSYNWDGFNPLGVKDDGADNKGYHAEYEFEVFNQSNGLEDQVTKRGFIKWIQFGITSTGTVESTLENCKVLGNFYGGGNLASVSGDVTSTLTNTQVDGSVFGAGFSAAIPTFQVQYKDGKVFPSINDAGVITEGHIPYAATVYEWTNDLNGKSEDERKADPTYQKGDQWYCYTWNSLDNLGTVTGDITLNIEGSTTVNGNVYGGGEESNVEGNTEVTMSGGTIGNGTSDNPDHGNVFGGGKGVEDLFTCEQAMVGVDGAGACENPDSDTNNNKGTSVTISNGTVEGNVYGGGEIGRVEWNTQVKIGVGTGEGSFAPIIKGNVFGAGKGLETHGYSALVRGNSTVTVQGSAKVLKNVYGGGEKSTVGRYWVKGIDSTPCTGETKPDAPDGLPVGMPYQQRSGGKCRVTVQGNAIIGPNEGAATGTAGHVFGAGKGVNPHYDANTSKKMISSNELVPFTDDETTGKTAEQLYLEFLQTLALVTNTYVTINGSAAVKGSVYGGSESGFVQHNTTVMVQNGTIGTSGSYGNIFGGGKGLDYFAEAGKVKDSTNVIVNNGTAYGNVYGGGELGDVGTIVKNTTNYNYMWTNNPDATYPNYTYNNTGVCNVTINGGIIGTDNVSTTGHVFGAGKGLEDTYWCEKAMVYKTNVSITDGTIKGSVYGGGQVGRVENNATVTIGGSTDSGEGNKPDIKGDVFGAGAGLVTHGYSALLRGNTTVTVQGIAKIKGSVYGGGETASVGRFNVRESLPREPLSGGTCKVTIQGSAVVGSDGSGEVFGACKGVTPDYEQATEHWMMDGTHPGFTSETEYLDFLKTLALTSNTEVTIGGSATVHGSVYGGGQRGVALGRVKVDMTGGTVNEDVYGGGALANTNTSHWDAVNNQRLEYVKVYGLTTDVSPVTGYYTKDGDNYTEITSTTATAVAETDYYARYTTTVNLTGGLIKGDAYGGGLGQKTGFNSATSDLAAVVYGDISVNLGSSAANSSATAFHVTKYTDTGHVGIVKSGRVFGCNNLMGSPQGDVRVTVYKTVPGNITRTTSDAITSNKALKESHPDTYETEEGYVVPTYEVATVYGGGNLADYTAAGKKTYVRIETCDVSIRDVYGGGNAAEVPETDVLVRGAYEIQEVFGGGNGKDPYTNGTEWIDNPGANIGNDTIPGSATTLLTGGFIHEAYGGSNEKGTVFGSVSIDMGVGSAEDHTDGACTLDVEKIVGAGKNADVNGDLIMVMGCKPSDKAPVLYAGADNANVKGDVELTITSGNFGKVFGGNNEGGAIFGHIKLNIEETGECETPITIDELYLGGNMASYSQFGYYQDGTIPGTTKPLYKGIESANDDTHTALYFGDGTANDHTKAPYAQPELNVVSCTYIGQIFGGGYGTGATLYGNPIVNINMIQGSHADDVHSFMANDDRLTALSLPSTDNPNNLGVIGDVFGGGNEADVIGDPTINIVTASKVQLHTSYDKTNGYTMSEDQNVLGAYIIGDVFGGGKGKDDTFSCEKAMIGIDGDGIENPDGGTTINIYNGTIRGNVYGGGKIGRVEKNTVVTIGNGDGDATVTSTSSAPVIMGNVFGGGKGKETHGYAALVRGNPTVTVQGNAKVLKSVYGGGEIASVARYKVAKDEQEAAAHGVAVDEPYVLANNTSGNCIVTVRGYTEIGPDSMQMTAANGPDDTGYVFGAGKGILPGGDYDFVQGTTKRMISVKDSEGHIIGSDWEYFANEAAYIQFIQTLALASNTDVTIGGHAFIKGSVYGGSENGLVQFDTDVKIQDHCQIGQGKEITTRYEDYTGGSLFGSNTPPIKSGSGATAVYYDLECASWTFAAPYAPYDPYANATGDLDKYSSGESTEGGRRIASDGHTYYGNVFGGGSGSIPYFDAETGVSKYLSSAGMVKGNTNVTISGGHILTSVYGGCEATNVLGVANVTMTAGTIGVPRTLDQILAHPVSCYLFGGGKGDQRVFFNKDTNVQDAVVKVEGGTIYGSVYGGGEDGHVLRNVELTIGTEGQTTGPTIGTLGTSYYDGNIFGGGRGFGGDALTAGNVGGSVDLTIHGGTILGSVYGGGRLASVGYGLYLTSETGYGVMRADDEYDGSYTNPSTDPAATFFNKGRGRIIMNINGGTIGNDKEYTYDANNELTHTKGGNVFAGGMGRMYQLDGTTPISSLDWWKLGCVKSTTLTISGDAVIKSCVYGGGELGQVVGYHSTKNAANEDVNVGTEVIINGGTIGTEIKDGTTTKYTFGSVFGGGYGSLEETLTHTGGKPDSYPKYIAGRVKGGTKVKMTTGAVLASVYGGGEMAAVGESAGLGETLTTGLTGDTHVIISGGTVGKSGFGGAKMGNVYGGGSGSNNTVRSGHVYGNSNVTISGSPIIYHNVYGGGAYGTVGDFKYVMKEDPVTHTNKVSGVESLLTSGTGVATVTITGGTIGINGKENGMVFGSSRGDINAPEKRDDHTAWVYNANVTIGDNNGGPAIKGSVYGSGENGHTFNNAVVTVNKGTIGIASGEAITYTENGQSVTKGGAEYPYRGNVYGGGCGTDKYYSNHAQETHDGNGQLYNPLAGIVYGNATVYINGGTVVRNVYGAGAMGSVGKVTTENETTTVTGGQTTISISGGTIGVNGTAGVGNVFGAARGALDAPGNSLALVAGNTSVSITGGTMYGNVYGGGELGYVGKYTTTIENGSKTNTWPTNTGHCLVTIDGSSASVKGHVFGAGKGSTNTFECEPAMVHSTNVNIIEGTVDGNVYGGGQLGRVEYNTVVKVGPDTGTDVADIKGYVFGAGAGVATHGYSALVRGNATVTVQGSAKVGKSVYGGGEIASVGRFRVVNSLPKEPLSGGNCTVAIKGNATIGASGVGYVFGACKGVEPDYAHNAGHVISTGESIEFANEAEYLSFLKTLALTSNPKVTIGGGRVNGSVFGGGQRGTTLGNVVVNMIGGTVEKDIYGGGALADTNTGNATDYGTSSEAISSTSTYTTTVNLLGGSINDVYGGALGQKIGDVNGGTSNVEAIVYGDVKVNVNGLETADYVAADHSSLVTDIDDTEETYYLANGGCSVSGNVYGCNNINGTPKGHAKVHVFKTVNSTKNASTPVAERTTYDVEAVFGGGNAADYVPAASDTRQSTEVIIEGCDLTSIKEVYGGGYGAATPGTNVLIKGTYIIDNVFGGGYGAGTNNSGANVGIRTDGTPYGIGVVNGTIVDDKIKIAVVEMMAGTVRNIFGGSNTKGDIRNGSSVTTVDKTNKPGCCTELVVEEIYGGGQEAEMEGGAEIVLGCMPEDWIGEIYAGAKKARVGNDVSLTITSGKFERVFGGNKSSGEIEGYVEVNIEECPTCGKPGIVIGELYGGGNEAAYHLDYDSYGQNYPSPRVNVRSFTSIGTIYGGGFGEGATVTGNPTVNINVGMVPGGGLVYDGDNAKSLDDNTTVKLYPHATGKIGVIGNVFGGGNAAQVIGNTTVNIGTSEYEQLVGVIAGETDVTGYYTRSGSAGNYVYTLVEPISPDTSVIAAEDTLYYIKVVGADIRGNVYGGGNNAAVTGNANVVIGRKETE